MTQHQPSSSSQPIKTDNSGSSSSSRKRSAEEAGMPDLATAAAAAQADARLQTLLYSILHPYPYQFLPQHISLLILEWVEKEMIPESSDFEQLMLWWRELVGYFAGDSDRTHRLIFRSLVFPGYGNGYSYAERLVAEKDPWLHFVLRHASIVQGLSVDVPIPSLILERCKTISIRQMDTYDSERMRTILEACGERTLRICKLSVRNSGQTL